MTLLTHDELLTLYLASTAHITCDLTATYSPDRYTVGGLGRHAGKPINAAIVGHLYRCEYLSTRELCNGEHVPSKYPYMITIHGLHALRANREIVASIIAELEATHVTA